VPSFWITTSWDDGNPLDLRLAEGLQKHGVSGTFYLTRDLSPRLTDAQIRGLAKQFEIGAHSLTHPRLSTLPLAKAKEEIDGSRSWLESLIGAPVNAFCYPHGAHNSDVRALVDRAGFRVARTVAQFHLDCGTDFFELPTTLKAYPFPLRPVSSWRARFDPIRVALPHVVGMRLSLADLRNWTALAKALLKRAAATGGVWHLWGHSWEIDKYGMWDELEVVLSAAGSYPGAQSVTNSQLATLATTPNLASMQPMT